MLTKIKSGRLKPSTGRYAIVASEYNARFVDAMLKGANEELLAAGAAEVQVVRVPGAFEIPVVAARLLRRGTPAVDAILCLGVIIRGETAHADHIGGGVTQALIRLQIDYGVPLVHEVLLLENTAQAEKRCLDPKFNRGREAARTAIQMVRVLREL